MNFRLILSVLSSIFLMSLIACGPANHSSKMTLPKNLRTPFSEADFKNYIESGKLTNLEGKKLPNIYLYFFDTLREDFITPTDAPTMLAFKEDSLPYVRAFPGATATHHSVFSLFYSRPAYERKLRIDQRYNLGGPFLRILKQHLQYQIHTFAYNKYLYCFDGQRAYNKNEDEHNALLYGRFNDLQDECPDYDGSMPGGNLAEIESGVIDNFLNFAERTSLKESQERQFFFLYQAFIHDHVWTKNTTNLHIPYDTNLDPHDLYKFPTSTRKTGVINSYKNSVKEADLQFKKFISYLKSIGEYDNSIIILFSDHGQNLYEKGAAGHGGPPFDEVIRVPLYIKLPKNQNLYLGNAPKYISTMDTFPTVMDAIGMQDYGQQFFFGESYFKHSHYSPIITQPEGPKDTPKFVMINEDYKVYGKIQSKEAGFFSSDSFEIESVRDHDDTPINLEDNYQNLKRRIRRDFSKTLQKMYQ